VPAAKTEHVVYSSIANITIDCADARAQAMFWAAVTGWAAKETDATPGHVEYALAPPAPGMPRMYFTTVPESKTIKNRVHLDLHPPGDQQAEVERLTALGARVLPDQPPDVGWIVMADPEGNEFCLEP
jgi:predicted enzyme related to lactoylglutathione lyase